MNAAGSHVVFASAADASWNPGRGKLGKLGSAGFLRVGASSDRQESMSVALTSDAEAEAEGFGTYLRGGERVRGGAGGGGGKGGGA